MAENKGQFSEGNKAAAKGRKVEKILEGILRAEDDKRLKLGLHALLDSASEGNLNALNFIADRLDGKPKQAVEMSSDPDNPPYISLVATAETLRLAIRGENAKD